MLDLLSKTSVNVVMYFYNFVLDSQPNLIAAYLYLIMSYEGISKRKSKIFGFILLYFQQTSNMYHLVC